MPIKRSDNRYLHSNVRFSSNSLSFSFIILHHLLFYLRQFHYWLIDFVVNLMSQPNKSQTVGDSNEICTVKDTTHEVKPDTSSKSNDDAKQENIEELKTGVVEKNEFQMDTNLTLHNTESKNEREDNSNESKTNNEKTNCETKDNEFSLTAESIERIQKESGLVLENSIENVNASCSHSNSLEKLNQKNEKVDERIFTEDEFSLMGDDDSEIIDPEEIENLKRLTKEWLNGSLYSLLYNLVL